MNVERLHSLLSDTITEIEDCNTLELLAGVRERTQQLASNPQNADVQREFSSQRTMLMEALEMAASNSFSPGTTDDLHNLQLSRLLGRSLADRIENIFEQNDITLAVASDQIIEVESELGQLYESLKAAVQAFEALSIDKDEPLPGEIEASVILPRSSVQNSLGALGTEFRELERVFADMTELASGSRPPTTVRSIAASDFSVYLELAPEVAAFLAVAVERVVALYRNLLEIRRIRSEAAAEGISDDKLMGIDEHIELHMNQGLDETVEVLLSESEVAVSDESRRNELKISLKRTLSGVAARVDRGYRFDIRIGHVEDHIDEDHDGGEGRSTLERALRTIENSREGLTFLKLEGEPILQLPSGESNDREDEHDSQAPN